MYEELDHSLPSSPLSMFHKKGTFSACFTRKAHSILAVKNTSCKDMLHMYEELDYSLPLLACFHKKGRFCPCLKKS